ncbi:MAG: hypothetical protein GY758_31710 [Fuerstiella sp.]|nr:hypothetical protein [Fuerstiella sp.]MCP4508069.1 hypothetical protein [Fuerstiella sp.]
MNFRTDVGYGTCVPGGCDRGTMRPEKNQHDCVIPRLAAAIKVADRETELSPIPVNALAVLMAFDTDGMAQP